MTDSNYRRQIILSDLKIDGYFRFGDVFQILPPDQDAPKPPSLGGHHPVILEYYFNTLDKYDEPQSSFPPFPHSWIRHITASEKVKEILLVLSVLTNCRFFT